MDYLSRKKMFFNLTIVDIDPHAINKLKQNPIYNRKDCFLYTADLGDLGFLEKDSFDFIVLSHTLSSINERPFKALKAIKECYRTIKEKGVLLIKEKISTIGNKRNEYKFYNWYRSRKYALEALSKNLAQAKTHFYLDDLKFAIKNMGFNIMEQKWLEDESIGKEKRIEHLKELMSYKDIISQYSEVFKIMQLEYDNLESYPAVYPPNIVLRCSIT